MTEAQIERLITKRRKAMRLKPCCRCGMPPEVDFGLIGARFEPGFEFIWCPAVLRAPGGMEQSCGTSAQGEAAWNYRPQEDCLTALLRRAHDAMSRHEPDGISDAEWDQLVADIATELGAST